MYYYRIYGQKIESDIDFRQLVKDDTLDQASITIRKGEMPENIIEEMKISYTALSKTESWFYNRTLRCLIRNGNEIIYAPFKNINEQYLRTYILGYGLSMLFLQRKKLAIHSSGVRKGKNAILISGVSGAGKSTLTTRFLENGYNFMADDITVVDYENEDCFAYPCFPFQKLCRNVVEQKKLNTDDLIYIDEDKDKYLVKWDGNYSTSKANLKALVVIHVGEEDSEVTIEEATGFEKLQYVLSNLFLKAEISFKENNPELVKLCLEIASRIRIYVITRPFGVDSSEEQLKLIENMLEEN